MALCLSDFEFFKVGGFLFVRDLQRQSEPLPVDGEVRPVGAATFVDNHPLTPLLLRCGTCRRDKTTASGYFFLGINNPAEAALVEMSRPAASLVV